MKVRWLVVLSMILVFCPQSFGQTQQEAEAAKAAAVAAKKAITDDEYWDNHIFTWQEKQTEHETSYDANKAQLNATGIADYTNAKNAADSAYSNTSYTWYAFSLTKGDNHKSTGDFFLSKSNYASAIEEYDISKKAYEDAMDELDKLVVYYEAVSFCGYYTPKFYAAEDVTKTVADASMYFFFATGGLNGAKSAESEFLDYYNFNLDIYDSLLKDLTQKEKDECGLHKTVLSGFKAKYSNDIVTITLLIGAGNVFYTDGEKEFADGETAPSRASANVYFNDAKNEYNSAYNDYSSALTLSESTAGCEGESNDDFHGYLSVLHQKYRGVPAPDYAPPPPPGP